MGLSTQPQRKLVQAIVKTLNLTVEAKIFDDFDACKNFITQHKLEYDNAMKRANNDNINFIIENLPLPKMLELLGYVTIKGKHCATYPVYDTDRENGNDRITCHLISPQQDSKIQKNYFVFFMPKDTGEPPQFQINGLKKLEQKRDYDQETKNGEKSGGTIINFLLNRTLLYSKGDVIKMLYDIASDDNNLAKYGFDKTLVANKNYEVSSSQMSKDRFDKWIAGWQKVKQISNEEKQQKTARYLNFYSDITNFLPLSNNIKISRIETLNDELFGGVYDKHYDSAKRRITSKTELTPPNNSLFEISCPICIIREKDGDIEANFVGDQKINVLCDDFFDKVRQNIEKIKNKHFGVNLELEQILKDETKLIKVVEKLSKMSVPDDLKTKEALTTMAKMLLVREYDFEAQGYKTTIITDQKKVRTGSHKGVSVFGIKAKETDTNRTMLIVENPILDGFSAIKLGYFDKNKTAVFGTIGNPSQEFYDSMKAFIFARHKNYNKIAIGTDNDEAGEKFFADIKQKFFEVYKDLFAKIVTSPNVLGQIHSFEDLKFHAQNIIDRNLLKQEQSIELMKSILNTDIVRQKPPVQYKDFNEELIEKSANDLNGDSIKPQYPKI